MGTIARDLREEIKHYIDHADDKVIKMVHAMLQADADVEDDWWQSLPENVKIDLEKSIEQADKEELINHEDVKKKFPEWFTK